ncbi:MAG: hypothetical protein Ta2E_10250 [Mycoplasmoidaceae bacterium]|nr:MAG: hypothetical protein Ta2E_10250 [Mycoplasmoidaceae bacterium]
MQAEEPQNHRIETRIESSIIQQAETQTEKLKDQSIETQIGLWFKSYTPFFPISLLVFDTTWTSWFDFFPHFICFEDRYRNDTFPSPNDIYWDWKWTNYCKIMVSKFVKWTCRGKKLKPNLLNSKITPARRLDRLLKQNNHKINQLRIKQINRSKSRIKISCYKNL